MARSPPMAKVSKNPPRKMEQGRLLYRAFRERIFARLPAIAWMANFLFWATRATLRPRTLLCGGLLSAAVYALLRFDVLSATPLNAILTVAATLYLGWIGSGYALHLARRAQHKQLKDLTALRKRLTEQNEVLRREFAKDLSTLQAESFERISACQRAIVDLEYRNQITQQHLSDSDALVQAQLLEITQRGEGIRPQIDAVVAEVKRLEQRVELGSAHQAELHSQQVLETQRHAAERLEEMKALSGKLEGHMATADQHLGPAALTTLENALRPEIERAVEQILNADNRLTAVETAMEQRLAANKQAVEHAAARVTGLEGAMLGTVLDGVIAGAPSVKVSQPDEGAPMVRATEDGALVATFGQRLASARTRAAQMTMIHNEVSAVALQAGDVRDDVATVKDDVSRLVVDLEKRAITVSELAQDVDQVRSRLGEDRALLDDLRAADARRGLGFRRAATEDDLERLEKRWALPLGLDVARSELRGITEKIYLAGSGVRRSSTSSVAALAAEVLLARSLQRKTLSILEIGTWLSSDTEMLYDLLKHQFDAVDISVIDPRSVSSRGQLPEVNRSWNGAGAEAASVRRTAVKTSKVDMLVIDGDRTAEGLAQCLAAFGPRLRTQGFVVVHGSGNPAWPGVDSFIQDALIPDVAFRHICTDWQVAAFRLKKAANKNKARRRRSQESLDQTPARPDTTVTTTDQKIDL